MGSTCIEMYGSHWLEYNLLPYNLLGIDNLICKFPFQVFQGNETLKHLVMRLVCVVERSLEFTGNRQNYKQLCRGIPNGDSMPSGILFLSSCKGNIDHLIKPLKGQIHNPKPVIFLNPKKRCFYSTIWKPTVSLYWTILWTGIYPGCSVIDHFNNLT